MQWFVAYVVCLLTFLVLDAIFIGLLVKNTYRNRIGTLINDRPRAVPGVILYLLYIGAVLVYGVWPLVRFFPHGLDASLAREVLLWGGGLGLIAFATYGLTAEALVRGWKWTVVAIDVAWGAVLTAVVTMIGYLIAH